MSGATLEDRLRATLAPYLRAGCLLAVSGGPDSTALMHVAARLHAEAGPPGPAALRVATVDHGLRPQARAEAEAVARQATALGLPHRILTWAGPHPAAGIQAAARKARYALLAAHAAESGCAVVLTAHTRDDQAETLILRLTRGSGPAGLAGMRPERGLAPGITLARPCLGIAKADLLAWCTRHGLAYVEDPSNTDVRFARARLRRLMPLLESEGLTAERLARLAARAARDETALQGDADAALARLARSGPEPGLHLDGSGFCRLPEAIALRVLDRALVRAGAGPGRLERLEALLAVLLPALREGRRLRRSLRGLLIDVDGAGALSLTPAPPRRSPPARRP